MIQPGGAQASDERPVWSLIGPALGSLLGLGLITVFIGPTLDAVDRALAGTLATNVALFAAYLIPAAITAPFGYVSRRWPLAAGVPALVLLLLGVLPMGVVPSAAGLIACRVPTGLGAGLATGLAWGMTADLGRHRSATRIGMGVASAFAMLLAPLLAWPLTETLSWRDTFLLAVPAAGLGLFVTVVGGIAELALAHRPHQGSGPSASK